MKTLIHRLILAFGTSTACLLFLLEPFLDPRNLIYHSSEPISTLLFVVPIEWYLFGLILTSPLVLVRESSHLWKPMWLCLEMVLPWIILKDGSALCEWGPPHWLSACLLLVPALCFLGLYFFRRQHAGQIFERAQHFTKVMLGFAAVLGVAVLLQLAWSAWRARNSNPPFQPAPHLASAIPGPNAWISARASPRLEKHTHDSLIVFVS